LAWLKVCYYAEVLERSRTFNMEKYLSLPFPYMVIRWWLAEFRIVEGRGEGTGRGFLRNSLVTPCDSDFGFCLVKTSWFGWPTCVEDCSFESPWRQADAQVRTYEKLFWLGDFKFSFGCLYFGIPHTCSPGFPLMHRSSRCRESERGLLFLCILRWYVLLR
jgi:hypothetical protein